MDVESPRVVQRVRTTLRGLPGRAAGRYRDAAWRIALAAGTAAVAWVVAQHLLGQRAPVFAPIAAVVCLTDSADKRGQRAVRLLAGVLVGVGVGELAARVLMSGWLQIALALAAAMLIVALGSINPLTLLQAGIAALIVVGVQSSQTGWTRLFSAVIGGVLALVVSQVLASPSPVRMLAGAVGSALRPVQDGLDGVVAALRQGSADRARSATETLRDGHDALSDFLDARSSVDRLAARTLRGRRERRRVATLQERFANLEYVFAGSVLLARTTTEVVEQGEEVPGHLVDEVADLAAAVRALAVDPGADDPSAEEALADRGAHAAAPGEQRRGAREVADALVAVDPDSYAAGPARLATQLHLLAVDVSALTASGGHGSDEAGDADRHRVVRRS